MITKAPMDVSKLGMSALERPTWGPLLPIQELKLWVLNVTHTR